MRVVSVEHSVTVQAWDSMLGQWIDVHEALHDNAARLFIADMIDEFVPRWRFVETETCEYEYEHV